VIAVLALAAGFGSAAVLSIPSQSAGTGQLLASSIALAAEGSFISGMQFDLQWDDGLELQIATGSELRNAGKLIYTTPLAGHGIRVLIVGVNQNRIADGELLRLFLVVKAPAGSVQVRVANLVAVTGGGDGVSIRAAAATIRIDPTISGTPILPESVLNAASLRPGSIAPGEIVTLLGAFGIDANSSPAVGATVNRLPAAVLYAFGNQVNIVVPYGLETGNPAELELHAADRQLAKITLPNALASPALFTQSGTGVGSGAILNQDNSPNSPANPAAAGSIVMVYGTSFGPVIPASGGRLPSLSLLVAARVSDMPSEVVYAGPAPGLAEGVIQINLRIPGSVPSGGAVPISLSAGNITMPDGVTLSVR
jgi:uncharacterized protein (TIGR03437 family)